MSSNVITKYKQNKQKVILTYAKILETLITLEDNTLWQKSKDFNEIGEGVVNNFVEKYYFDNNINRNNPIEYLNDNINAVLISIMDYYKEKNKPNIVKEKKNETFLISVIVCTASFIDIASNVVDGNYIVMKSNLKKLLKHLSKTELLKVYYNNKIILNKLFEEVKKNINNDKKFFSYFKNPNWHNEYQLVSEEPEYYRVRFIYKVEGLENYERKLVQKYQKKYLKDFLKVCYELLVVLLMKEYIMNKKVNTYLIPVIDEVKNDLSILDIPLIKDNIRLFVPIEKYEEYEKEKRFKVTYFYHGKDVKVFDNKKDIEVVVDKEFMTNNSANLKNIKLIAEDLGKNMKEEEICIVKEEVL